MIKSKRMEWVVHVARMGKINGYKILIRNLKGRHLSQDLSVDGKIILEWILEK
jgi:hypothetical protein